MKNALTRRIQSSVLATLFFSIIVCNSTARLAAQMPLAPEVQQNTLFTPILETQHLRRLRLDLSESIKVQYALKTQEVILKDFTLFTPSASNQAAQQGNSSNEAFGQITSQNAVMMRRGGVLEFPSIAVGLREVEPFLSFSVKLYCEKANAANVQVFVRPLDENGAELSERLAVQFDHHCEDMSESEQAALPMKSRLASGTTLTTNLAFLPKETRFVHLRIEFMRTAEFSEPILRGMEVFAHNPKATDAATLQRFQSGVNTSVVGNVAIGNPSKQITSEAHGSALPRPAFVTRTDWGCPWGQTSGPNTLTPTPPTHLIVHHSFSPGNNISDWSAAVRSVWTFHVMSNGWSDIGYNWLIDPQGNIYQGRAWVGEDDNTQGAHFCGFNRNTMGVCMLGDFTSITPTDAALKSLVRILGYRASASNINVRGTSPHANSQLTLNNISGHRDGCSTECPGGSLYPLLPTVRNRVFALMNPPSMRSQAMQGAPSRDEAQLSCLVQPNGSETEVFIEWAESSAATPIRFTNRRSVQRLAATAPETSISAALSGLRPALRYAYRFVAENSDTSTVAAQGEFTTLNTSVQNRATNAENTLRVQPNPISGNGADISYRLESSSNLELQIVSSTGQVLRTLAKGVHAAGEYRVKFDGANLASGVYYCRLQLVSPSTRQTTVPVVIAR
ncbi:MAG: hypothetical protein EAZ92_07615 [Candidatus Kapaibacterium sp.]|nr:MAG: hypothetical protein EAZ92_07615 [Candidatus Kapabacteria bacterium]